MTHVVVIGAGQAGSSLVEKLRHDGFDGQITLIGKENARPYQRPPLSKKYLLGEMGRDHLFLRPEHFYSENEIELCLDEPVEAIDRAEKVVITAERRIAYDELVLTTGSEPRRLPRSIGGALEGVHVIRDLKDVDDTAPEFREGARVLIVGGGYIGLETAAAAVSRGLKVTLVEMSERILCRVAAPQTSDFFRALHQHNGVDIREGVGLERLLGADRVAGARLSDGSELALDLVICGLGITPATTLAEAAGLEVDNGIKVDGQGRTSDPYIWAAGDCASFLFNGSRIRLESVPNAIDQAECVAGNLMGAKKNYVAKPWFWSDQYDVKLQIAGLNTGYDRVITRAGEAGSASFWYYEGAELRAVDAMNAPRDYMIAKRLIEGGKSPASDLVENPETSLKALLKH